MTGISCTLASHLPLTALMGFHKERRRKKRRRTHRLQLVHELHKELPAFWSFAVQLHARLHGVEPTCKRKDGGVLNFLLIPSSPPDPTTPQKIKKKHTPSVKRYNSGRFIPYLQEFYLPYFVTSRSTATFSLFSCTAFTLYTISSHFWSHIWGF